MNGWIDYRDDVVIKQDRLDMWLKRYNRIVRDNENIDWVNM